MSVQGHLLDITVIGCRNLKDKEWISRQDPYVILEYAGNKYRTKTDTDGGRNPTFNEKYMLPLIEGLREVSVAVWNSNTLSPDDFIGSGKILLQKVLTDGYHDNTWPLSTKSGRRAGEIRVILHYTSPKGAHNVTSSGCTQHAPPVHPATPVYSPYTAPPVYPPSQPSGYAGYPPVCAPYPPPSQPPYPPYGAGGYAPPASYGGQPPYPYPPQSYPPQGYPPYPPQGYGGYGTTPSGTYPPQGHGGYGTPPSGTYPPY